MRTKTIARLIVLLALSSRLHAQQEPAQDSLSDDHAIEAYIAENAIQALYVRDIDLDQVGSTELAMGMFFNEERDLIGTGTALTAVGRTDRFRRFDLRVGPRMYAAFLNTENQDIFGISVGGEARYFMGNELGSAIVLSAFYAPDILVFGAADEVLDASVRFEVGLRANTSIFVGYRSFDFGLNTAEDRDVDDDVHIGFRSRF